RLGRAGPEDLQIQGGLLCLGNRRLERQDLPLTLRLPGLGGTTAGRRLGGLGQQVAGGLRGRGQREGAGGYEREEGRRHREGPLRVQLGRRREGASDWGFGGDARPHTGPARRPSGAARHNGEWLRMSIFWKKAYCRPSQWGEEVDERGPHRPAG